MKLSKHVKQSRQDSGLFLPPGPRWIKALMAILLAAGTTTACGTAGGEPPRQYTPAQQRMLARFGDIGYELKVDAMKGEEFLGVNFYVVGLSRPFYGKAHQTLRNEVRLAMNGPIPEHVRIVWRRTGKVGSGPKNYDDYVDDIIGDEVIEVGSRIPQEVIDDLKRDPKGSLRLKFRMSRQGTLLGWDIERRPGYDPNKRDQFGQAMYAATVYSGVGGDFREAKIFNGKVVRPGWYIDRKTGNKIETDF